LGYSAVPARERSWLCQVLVDQRSHTRMAWHWRRGVAYAGRSL